MEPVSASCLLGSSKLLHTINMVFLEHVELSRVPHLEVHFLNF